MLSLRENELTELPASLGQLEELTVLDVVGNRLAIPESVGVNVSCRFELFAFCVSFSVMCQSQCE